jgi:hypothetical protein
MAKGPCKPTKGKRSAKRVNGKCVSYGKKGVTPKPGTKKGDAYCARSAKIKGSGAANRLARKSWGCKGAKSRG